MHLKTKHFQRVKNLNYGAKFTHNENDWRSSVIGDGAQQHQDQLDQIRLLDAVPDWIQDTSTRPPSEHYSCTLLHSTLVSSCSVCEELRVNQRRLKLGLKIQTKGNSSTPEV